MTKMDVYSKTDTFSETFGVGVVLRIVWAQPMPKLLRYGPAVEIAKWMNIT